MKLLQLAFVFCITATACRPAKEVQGNPVALETLRGYNLKDPSQLAVPFNYFVVNNATDFNNYFAQPSSGSPLPDFKSLVVVAAALKPDNVKATLQFDKAEIAGKKLNVYYTLTDDATPLEKPEAAFALAALPRSQSVRQVNFITNGTIHKTLALHD